MTIVDQCLLDLGLLFYPFFSILSFEECQVCVHYLEIIILTAAISIGVLLSIIIQVHIHTRLLINAFLWENINNDTLNTSGLNATMIAPWACG